MGSTFSHIFIYNIENPVGMLEPIAEYNDFGASQYCLIHENNNQKYLYHFQSTAFSIYEINDYGIDDEPEANEQLLTSYPNPFSTSTTISFELKSNSHNPSQIKIYNIKGQLVRELLPVAPSPSLPVSVTWDGIDESGKEVKSGVYLYKMGDEDGFIGKVVKLRYR